MVVKNLVETSECTFCATAGAFPAFFCDPDCAAKLTVIGLQAA